MQIDAFNGDADGLCALVQLRLADPKPSTLITGVKRDIQLLERVEAGEGDVVTVLDVSLKKNAKDVERLLANGAKIFYCDHHQAVDIAPSSRFESVINLAPDVCTSLLINGHLKGQFAAWAVVGAFGDNLDQSAMAVAKTLNLSEQDIQTLSRLGLLLNYNGYGETLDDLYFAPDSLFNELVKFESPMDFVNNANAIYQTLDKGYDEDFAKANEAKLLFDEPHAKVLLLPNAPWARRVSGVFGNALAKANPEKAHAVITEKSQGGYLVSVRAPLNNKQGADEVCSQFPTGGGRAAAAGINDLPKDSIQAFIDAFSCFYQ